MSCGADVLDIALFAPHCADAMVPLRKLALRQKRLWI